MEESATATAAAAAAAGSNLAISAAEFKNQSGREALSPFSLSIPKKNEREGRSWASGFLLPSLCTDRARVLVPMSYVFKVDIYLVEVEAQGRRQGAHQTETSRLRGK